jgi:thiol-disulfide isomerase/thioredoxin
MSETLPKPNRAWWYLAIGFAVCWMLYLAFLAPRRPGGRALLENSAMSQPADYDWSLRDLEDQPVPFARFKGKTLFLNIWATWCRPCVAELPSIASLARNPRLRGKNIEFVCVSVDDSTDVVRRFKDGKDWTMTVLRADKIPSVFYTEGIPATFLIAPDGRIAASEVGAADWSEPRVVALLEKLASSSAP